MLLQMKQDRQRSLIEELRLIRERRNRAKYSNSVLRIQELRTAAGLSQSQLSEISHVARSYISELERGILNNPTIDIVLKLAKGLGCTFDDLVKYKEVY
jgi:DNA-binding XRE family transcriptional regulator